MTRVVAIATIFLCLCGRSWAQRQSEPSLEKPHTGIPVYRITFKESDPVKGVGAAPAFRLPFHCTADGSVFIMTVQPVNAGAQPKTAPTPDPTLLISVSPSGEARSFPLNQINDLFDVHPIAETESESKVVFVVSAALADGSGKGHGADLGGSPQGDAKDRPERHEYLVTFDREGNYQKKIQLEPTFRISNISAFSSGSFLAYGYDAVDHSPKLALFREDGRLLGPLEISKGNAPESVLGSKNAAGKGLAAYLASVQLIPQGQYIYLLQMDTDYPILRIGVGGAIDPLKPKLPADAKIAMLIPSDENLYAIINTANAPEKPQAVSVVEMGTPDGLVLRQLRLGNDESAYGLACVHDKKFFLFHHGEGQLIPLVGIAAFAGEAATASADH